MSDQIVPPETGRDPRGRFTKGWRGGPGNPHAQQAGRLRSALMMAVSPEDMQAIVARLVQMAKDGDVAATREVLNRTLGRPTESDLIARLESLERMARERTLA